MNVMTAPSARKIIHVDMDAFYASSNNETIRTCAANLSRLGERLLVVWLPRQATRPASLVSRSAMPSVTAARKCPHLIFVKPRFEVYRSVSQQIREIFAEYTPLIEPLSLDEAYLDVTENLKEMPIATEIALEIRAKIKIVTGSMHLPHFLQQVPRQDGVGPQQPNARPSSRRRTGRLSSKGSRSRNFTRWPSHRPEDAPPRHRNRRRSQIEIATVPDRELWENRPYFFGIARGIDERPVRPDRIRKSVGAKIRSSTTSTISLSPRAS